ncbi:MAG: aminotransferase class V-fold PLP-dependent enzyme, partial [Sulfitobacter sp.]
FVVASSLKWLCGTPGAGVIQIRPDLLKEVRPELRGWFSQDNPFSWDLNTFDYAPDARRLEHGTPSVLACLGSIPALRWHSLQTDLLARNREMTAMIIEEAGRVGLTLATPKAEAQRGGSVMLCLPDGADTGGIIDGLAERELLADCRGRILRLSPGSVTEMRHVERLCEALHSLI